MSPMTPVTIQTRRGLVAVCMVALFALPVAAWAAGTRVTDTARFAEEIQQQRAESILFNCRDTNRRHDETIATLDALLVKRVKTAGRRERVKLKASRESTVALIEALAPKRDCAAQLRRLAPPPQQ